MSPIQVLTQAAISPVLVLPSWTLPHFDNGNNSSKSSDDGATGVTDTSCVSRNKVYVNDYDIVQVSNYNCVLLKQTEEGWCKFDGFGKK